MTARCGSLAALVWAGAATLGCAGGAGVTPVPPAPSASPAVATPSAGPPSQAPLAPTPDPRRPLGPPEAAAWVFGTVEEVWRVEGERVALYDVRERLTGKAPGTFTATYVRVDGVVHALHWDDAAKAAALAPGATVNLYVAGNVVCVADPSHPVGTRCWRLMHVFPGRRRQPPLQGL